jgi:hypothetical protein
VAHSLGAVDAIAVDPRGRLAVGDSRGLRIGHVEALGSLRRLAVRGAVRELGWLRGDFAVLLAVTEAGLYRVEDDRVEIVSSMRARRVERIATHDGAAALATDDGVWTSRDGRTWERLMAVPGAAVEAVALRGRGATECWAVANGKLWRVGLPVTDSLHAEPISLPLRIDGALDLVFSPDGTDVAVLDARGLIVGTRRPPHGWQRVGVDLPPGSRAHRVVVAGGRYWLASDRGVSSAEEVRGPWRLAGALAAEAANDLDATDRELWVATPRGVTAVGATPNVSSARKGVVPTTAVADNAPPIGSVHRAALRYLELDRSRVDALQHGLDRRGFWPRVDLVFGVDLDRSRGADTDEAWVSGDLRRLHDRDRDRSRAFDARLGFSWDLGDLAYHPEQIDVSRERREVLELRDEVLDEINQLYFERRRVLAQLAQPGPVEGEALRARAQRLQADIDAWTGGWFSHQIDSPRPTQVPQRIEREHP